MALHVDRTALWTVGPVCLASGLASSWWQDNWIWMISFTTIGAVLILGTAPDESEASEAESDEAESGEAEASGEGLSDE